MKKTLSILFVAVLSLAMSNYAFSVNVRVTPTSTDYTTLQAAFTAINAGTHGANPTLTVMDNFIEPAGAVLASTGYTTLLITTSGTFTVSGSFNAPIITFNNADNVTIDGRVGQVGSTRSLTLSHTSIVPAETLIGCLNYSNGSSNCNVRYVNMLITGNTSGRILNIAQSASAGNNDILVEFCLFDGATRGIQTFGTAGVSFNERGTFRNNTVKNAASIGIFLGSEQTDAVCNDNLVFYDRTIAVSTNHRAISFQGLGNVSIQRNKVYDLQLGAGSTFFGFISIPFIGTTPNPPATTTLNIINNCVTLMSSNVGVTQIIGIAPLSLAAPNGAPYTANVYNNTCKVGGTDLTTAAYNAPLLVDMETPGSTSNVKNNVAINTRFNAPNSTNIGMDLTVYPFPGVAFNSDYNHAFALDTASGNGWAAGIANRIFRGDGGLSLYKDTACALFPGDELHTMFKNVNFTGSNLCNLGLVGGDMCGMPLASVTTDINGNARNASYPYKGAFEGSALKVLTLGAKLEGVTNSEQVTVLLKNGACGIISSCTADLNGTGVFCFGDSAANGTGYYIEIQSRNDIRTASAGTNSFAGGILSYNFRSAQSQAYGSNMIFDGGDYALYGGDVNQDGVIELGDVAIIDNDAYNFLAGCRVKADVNNDGVVDVTDAGIADNNAFNFVGVNLPCPEPTAVYSNYNTEKQSAPVLYDLRKVKQNALGF